MSSTELKPADIKRGAFVWYSGATSIGRWNCPAIITSVSRKKKTFKLRSLDDMHEQEQPYDFDSTENYNMLLVSQAAVQEYLVRREAVLRGLIENAQIQLAEAQGNLMVFCAERKKLGI